MCGQENGGCDLFLCYMLKSWDIINNNIIVNNNKKDEKLDVSLLAIQQNYIII